MKEKTSKRGGDDRDNVAWVLRERERERELRVTELEEKMKKGEIKRNCKMKE